MGVAITELLIKKEIEIRDLSNKIIAIDAPLFLYQFLTTIRAQDGTPLTDSKCRVTSHLIGLFFRTMTFLNNDLKLVFIFDGKAPELKTAEREARRKLKEKAQRNYEIAKQRKDIKEMEKYAKRTSKLDKDMIDEAIRLIDAMGIPYVLSPSEAEAQASHMVKKGDCYAVSTQDTDTLMFGAPRLIKNLSLAGKRKRSKKLSFETYKPELITLKDNLDKLQISQDDLIALCMLVGTDFNVGGIKGLGPKKSLDVVRNHKGNHKEIFDEAGWDKQFDFSWKEVMNLIKKMDVTDDYSLEWKRLDEEKILDILVGDHDFSEERVKGTLAKHKKEASKQKGLNEFF